MLIPYPLYSAYHQHFGIDVTSHANTSSTEICRGANTEQALTLCDVATKVLVKSRIVPL